MQCIVQEKVNFLVWKQKKSLFASYWSADIFQLSIKHHIEITDRNDWRAKVFVAAQNSGGLTGALLIGLFLCIAFPPVVSTVLQTVPSLSRAL